jgi:ABC-type lipopolysaccharide export system ATPase subunit
VKAERAKVKSLDMAGGIASEKYPLIIRDVRKVYGSGKYAVKGINLAVQKNMVFGLLGPVRRSRIRLHLTCFGQCICFFANSTEWCW